MIRKRRWRGKIDCVHRRRRAQSPRFRRRLDRRSFPLKSLQVLQLTIQQSQSMIPQRRVESMPSPNRRPQSARRRDSDFSSKSMRRRLVLNVFLCISYHNLKEYLKRKRLAIRRLKGQLSMFNWTGKSASPSERDLPEGSERDGKEPKKSNARNYEKESTSEDSESASVVAFPPIPTHTMIKAMLIERRRALEARQKIMEENEAKGVEKQECSLNS